MAIAQTTLTTTEWTVIGAGVTSITFQVVSSNPVYIGIGTTAGSISSTTPGLIYKQFEGELKKNPADLTFGSPGISTYVLARAVTSTGTINYETA